MIHNKIVLTVLAAAIVTLFIKLSIWQWHRYHFKKNLEQTFIYALQETPHNLLKIGSTLNSKSYSKIFAEGHYMQKQFLLDNQIKNNQAGFAVITPFQLNNGATILVNRGFVPADSRRKIHIDITPPTQALKLIGLLNHPSKSFVLGPIVENSPIWPKEVMRIDPGILSATLGTPLLDAVILLDKNQPHGYLRNWAPPNLWSLQSLGYCFQWLAMALTVIVLYFIMLFKSIEKKNVSS